MNAPLFLLARSLSSPAGLFVCSLDRWIAQDFDNLELKLKELDAAEAEAEAAEKAAKGESTVLEEVCTRIYSTCAAASFSSMPY